MAKITGNPTIALKVTIELSEQEARALQALACYGADAFLKTFYAKIGEHYLKPHEDGIRSLFGMVNDSLPRVFAKADEARKIFNGGNPK